MDRRQILGGSAALVTSLARPAVASAPIQVSLFFPIAVGGPITRVVDSFAAEFGREFPQIKVTPVYTGNYQDTLAAFLSAHRSREAPTLSVLLSTDMFTLVDEEAVIPFDRFTESDEDQSWLRDFYPAFMLNSRTEWRTWGIPFQRSTILLYWNKNAFEQAGLNPERAPGTWAEHVTMAEALTRRDAAGRPLQWGTQIPSTRFAYSPLQALAMQSGARLANLDGNRTGFDDPGTVEALTYLVDLSRRHKVMMPGQIDWSATPGDFVSGRTAMMWTTTGNLTDVRNKAPFPFGVAVLPANKRRASPTGGGNFYLTKQATSKEQEAAVAFVRWVTRPQRAAAWSIATGYVAIGPAAYETPLMREYLRSFPAAAIARDQLRNAGPELSTHENQRVTQVLETAIAAAVGGMKTPEQALRDAQAAADQILKPYR